MSLNKGLRLLAVLVLVGGVWVAHPVGQAKPAESIFTMAQADAGRATYKTACASCHTADLGGSNEFPQLAGDDFMSAWKTRKVSELYEFIHATMPPEGPALAPDQALGLIAFILQQNGAAAGATALSAATTATVGSVATGKRPSPLR